LQDIGPGASYSQARDSGEYVHCDTATAMRHGEQDGLLPSQVIYEFLSTRSCRGLLIFMIVLIGKVRHFQLMDALALVAWRWNLSTKKTEFLLF